MSSTQNSNVLESGLEYTKVTKTPTMVTNTLKRLKKESRKYYRIAGRNGRRERGRSIAFLRRVYHTLP
jgi:hypothetical protein